MKNDVIQMILLLPYIFTTEKHFAYNILYFHHATQCHMFSLICRQHVLIISLAANRIAHTVDITNMFVVTVGRHADSVKVIFYVVFKKRDGVRVLSGINILHWSTNDKISKLRLLLESWTFISDRGHRH